MLSIKKDDVVQAEHDIHEIKSSAQYGRAVDRKELPTRVKRALRQSTYKGWQEGTIYYDETRNVYTIIISSQNRYYRLNDQGEPWRE
jgi:hypothetical protein